MKVWCVGNEMDGPWQIGAKDAVAYGKLANEAGKAMRLVDPGIELVVCGSSNSSMPTFGAWEDTVLDLTWDVADHISLHTYYDPARFRTLEDYLACSRDLDHMIETVAATADAVAGRRRSRKRMSLSVDEWNVWYQTANSHNRGPEVGFEVAPAIAEDTYTVTDALVVGCLLITLLRHADRVRMACLAQLVNVIPPIRTLDGGPAWRQTTFFPFAHAARHGHGTVLRVEPACERAGGDRGRGRGRGDACSRSTAARASWRWTPSSAACAACWSTSCSPTRTRTPPTRPSSPTASSRARIRAPSSRASGCARRCRRAPGTSSGWEPPRRLRDVVGACDASCSCS